MNIKKRILIFVLLLWSCNVERPGPVTFLEYGHPAFQGFNAQKLSDLNELIEAGSFGEIHSLIIIRNDKIVFENYYAGYERDEIHAIGASTQSIVSGLAGIVLDEDSTVSTRTKIIDLLPEYSTYFENVPQKDEIAIGHLLSNRSGLWWDELSQPFGNTGNDAYVMTLSNDWIANILSTPMIREPGFEFNYNSGNAILMAPILENVTGKQLETTLEERLFDPLEIYEYQWEEIPGGFANSSWGLHMRPLDLAKIGYLYLNEGKWEDIEIIPKNWIERSTRHRSTASIYFSYGYFWWRFQYYNDVIQGLYKNDIFFSWGDGGQFMFVIPHLNMVVVTTASNFGSMENRTFEMLQNYIFSAVNNSNQ